MKNRKTRRILNLNFFKFMNLAMAGIMLFSCSQDTLDADAEESLYHESESLPSDLRLRQHMEFQGNGNDSSESAREGVVGHDHRFDPIENSESTSKIDKNHNGSRLVNPTVRDMMAAFNGIPKKKTFTGYSYGTAKVGNHLTDHVQGLGWYWPYFIFTLNQKGA